MTDRKEYQKAWREKNIEKEKARQRAYYRNNKEAQRERDLKSRYGLSLEDYDKMTVAQQGQCAVCGIKEEMLKDVYKSHHARFCVDHNHETGEVRQLICHKCNTLVGYLETRAGILQKALDYLEKHKTTT